jgi:CRP-like cAMP-binding protein
MDKIKLLAQIPAFASLTASHRSLLAASLGSQTFERGETIFHQGSLGSVLFIIISGQVRIYTISEVGQELSVTIFREGDFFGEMALLDGQPRSASATAMCPTTTLTLHRSAFLHTLGACPPIAVAILEALAGRLRLTTTNAGKLASNSAPQRVVHQLVELVERYGLAEGGHIRIDLHLTQDDLASLSGTTRETVNRVLAGLRSQGIIRTERASVSVLDVFRLKASLEEILR